MSMARKGFSIIEMMIGLGLASVIMLALTQGYRNALRMQENANSLLSSNRRIALLFNQLERDVTTAYAPASPVAYQKPKKKEEGAAKESEVPAEDATKKNGPAEKKEPMGAPFTLEYFDDASYRHRNKKWERTKKVSFVTTSPLEVFEDEQVRAVRVGYELLLDKEKSSNDRQVYRLMRKQTAELSNEKFKEKEGARQSMIASHVVAEYVKTFSLEAAYYPRPPQTNEEKKDTTNSATSSEKKELIQTFSWGEREEKKSSTSLPETLLLHVELWSDNFAKSYSFECLLPLLGRDGSESNEKAPEAKKIATPPEQKSNEGIPPAEGAAQ